MEHQAEVVYTALRSQLGGGELVELPPGGAMPLPRGASAVLLRGAAGVSTEVAGAPSPFCREANPLAGSIPEHSSQVRMTACPDMCSGRTSLCHEATGPWLAGFVLPAAGPEAHQGGCTPFRNACCHVDNPPNRRQPAVLLARSSRSRSRRGLSLLCGVAAPAAATRCCSAGRACAFRLLPVAPAVGLLCGTCSRGVRNRASLPAASVPDASRVWSTARRRCCPGCGTCNRCPAAAALPAAAAPTRPCPAAASPPATAAARLRSASRCDFSGNLAFPCVVS